MAKDKARLLASMFLSTALAIGMTGCSSSSTGGGVSAGGSFSGGSGSAFVPGNDQCLDVDEDGYCDDDRTSRGSYYGTHGGKAYYERSSSYSSRSGVSTGSRGGLGSSASSSGGYSGSDSSSGYSGSGGYSSGSSYGG